jgi:hypothetical protein
MTNSYTITLSDKLDSTGLTIATSNEILTQLTNALTAIYGSDVVLDSNTADGQFINISTQFNIDFRELLQEIYNSFAQTYTQLLRNQFKREFARISKHNIRRLLHSKATGRSGKGAGVRL